jgi:hypothetical protein
LPEGYDHVRPRLPTFDRERQPLALGRYREYTVENADITDRLQTTRRLGRFLGGPFAGENLSSALEVERIHDEEHVWMRVWSAPVDTKITFSQARSELLDSSRKYEKGTVLGPSFTNHWIHVKLRIPESFKLSPEPIICK